MDLRSYCFESATSAAVVQSLACQSEPLVLKWPTDREARWAGLILFCQIEISFPPPNLFEACLYFILLTWYIGIQNMLPESNDK